MRRKYKVNWALAHDGEDYGAGDVIELKVGDAEPLLESGVIEKDGPKVVAAEIKASPAAIALAEKHSVDLADITGSGKGGIVTKGDVEAFLDATETGAAGGLE